MKNPDILWKQAAGLRDILIHEYDTLDVEQVWQTTCASGLTTQ
jgi:uncharacterized protein with HEPN domain